jgi:hypothetical protein
LKIGRFLLLITAFSLIPFGCAHSEITNEDKIYGIQIGKELKNVLTPPDKIILYAYGTQKEIEKSDPRFAQIVDMTNKRFHNKLSTAKDMIDDEAMEHLRKDGLGVEFIYFNQRDMSIKGDGFQPFKYYKLYFQLTSQKSGYEQGSKVHTFQHAEKDGYTEYSRGPLKYSEELVNLVKDIK